MEGIFLLLVSLMYNQEDNDMFPSSLLVSCSILLLCNTFLLLQAPASEIQDKISFIINNLAVANLEAKAKEFMEILKEQYYPWFAQYMVMKRSDFF